ncbi:hypothetical protein [Anaerosinus sp.]|uniref:hypothetical protein n=1 Tax=Selenobaculum sp. TaxID=3074374 RepID=UPI003AB57703
MVKENKETLTDVANGKTDIGLNVSLGTSKSESSYKSETELNQGSTIHATGDVNIKAKATVLFIFKKLSWYGNLKEKGVENYSRTAKR